MRKMDRGKREKGTERKRDGGKFEYVEKFV